MSNPINSYKALLENVACNICGSDSYDIIYPPKYEGAKPEEFTQTFRSSGDETLIDQLVQCKQCGLYYLNPRPKQNLIIQSYSEGSDETFISQVISREHTFARCLNIIEKVMPKRGKILDIGTAGGSFLGVAKQHGWEVAGCEPNRWLADWGSKHYDIPIQAGTIFDMNLDDASLDVVTLWDVLEHTPDPKAVLSECSRVLKPNGLLVVNYPDINSLVASFMRRKWVFLLSVHLYYFTPKTIKKLLELTGFELIKQQKHWQTLELGYIFFRMKPYISWASSLGTKLVDTLHIQHTQVPYWMGQSLILARRTDKTLMEAQSCE